MSRNYPKQWQFKRNFLDSEGINPSHTGVFKPGYGPHTSYQWEVQLETNLLEHFAKGVAWLALNRNGLSVFAHPVTHNQEKLDRETEAEDHKRSVIMGNPPQIDLNFFYHPPLDPVSGEIKDTFTPNLIPEGDVESYEGELKIVDLFETLTEGFDFHVDFSEEKRELAPSSISTFFTIHHWILKQVGLQIHSRQM